MVSRIPPRPANNLSVLAHRNGHAAPVAFRTVRQAAREASQPCAVIPPMLRDRLAACRVEISHVSVVWAQRSSEDR